MKEIILQAIQSKRFIAFIISIILFLLLIFLTNKPPMELAGAISLIAGIYITGDTIRSSDTGDTNTIKTTTSTTTTK